MTLHTSTLRTSTFRVEEMCCSAEEQLIRKRLEPIDEVDALEFNLISRTVRVRHALADDARLVREIAATVMKAVPERDAASSPVHRVEVEKPWYRNRETLTLIVAGIGAVIAESLAIAGYEESTAARIIALVAVVSGGYRM